jgi:hypothetical protein
MDTRAAGGAGSPPKPTPVLRIPPASKWVRRAWKAALERLARAGGLSV